MSYIRTETDDPPEQRTPIESCQAAYISRTAISLAPLAGPTSCLSHPAASWAGDVLPSAGVAGGSLPRGARRSQRARVSLSRRARLLLQLAPHVQCPRRLSPPSARVGGWVGAGDRSACTPQDRAARRAPAGTPACVTPATSPLPPSPAAPQLVDASGRPSVPAWALSGGRQTQGWGGVPHNVRGCLSLARSAASLARGHASPVHRGAPILFMACQSGVTRGGLS